MSYLLDTDIVIYHLNDIAVASDLVDALFDDGVAISSISYVEVLDGIDRSPDPQVARDRFAAMIETMPVVDFKRREADVLIEIRQALRAHGRDVRRRALDLQIAATAVAHELTLVANNPDDYRGIDDLKLHPARIAL